MKKHPADYAAEFLIPALMVFIGWCAAEFPLTDADKWLRILLIPIICWLPFKLLKIIIHKQHGLLRQYAWPQKIASLLMVGLWVAFAVFGLFEVGLAALIGTVIFGYLLFLIWQNISGEDEQQNF